MRLIIFGATGGTGCQLVKQALEQKHAVTAFVRKPEKMEQRHQNLTVVKGDALDFTSVENAILNHDAVLCALGMPNILDKSRLRTMATENIVSAMEKLGVKKLVCLSGFGAGDSLTELPFHYRYLIAPLFMRRLYADHNEQEKCIKQSQLRWSIARPATLTNGAHTGEYQCGCAAEKKSFTLKISRADTADFMLKQLVDERYLYQTPFVSY